MEAKNSKAMNFVMLCETEEGGSRIGLPVLSNDTKQRNFGIAVPPPPWGLGVVEGKYRTKDVHLSLSEEVN